MENKMSVRTYFFTDNKKWVDCIAETIYKYDDNNVIELSCRRRAKCCPEDVFDLKFGKELAKAKAFVVLNKKKLDYLYELSRKFSREQKANKFVSKLSKLNELELEEIYQALQEMHRSKR